MTALRYLAADLLEMQVKVNAAGITSEIGELQIMTPLFELSRQADPVHRDPSAAVWLTRLVRGLSPLHTASPGV